MLSSSPRSLMAASLPVKPSKPLCASFASRTSVFFGHGRSCLPSRSIAVVSTRRSGAGALPRGLTVRCLFGLGVPELVVIAGVAALVFGPKQLPEIGRNIGKTVKSFQKAAKEFETELKKEPEDAINPPPSESPKPVSGEEEKKEQLEASGTKEST